MLTMALALKKLAAGQHNQFAAEQQAPARLYFYAQLCGKDLKKCAFRSKLAVPSAWRGPTVNTSGESFMEFDIVSIVLHSSLMAQLVLALLVFMSVMSWAMMIQKWFLLGAALTKAEQGLTRFEQARDLREAVQTLGTDPSSPLYYVAHQGVLEFNRSKDAGNDADIVVDNVRRSLRQGVGTEISRLQSSLSILATTANTAPFIGLFGTVWGILTSFHSIGLMKSASIATVAPGISEALIATALGLAVAIPATVGYNIFLAKMGDVDTKLVNFAGAFLNRVQRELNAQRPVKRFGATE